MKEFNPDLPILDELGAEFEALAQAAYRAEVGDAHSGRRRARLAPSKPRTRRGQARRIARRATIVVVLICLIGGVALAARFSGGDSNAPGHTAPTVLGHATDGAWTLSTYRDKGRLCMVFLPRGGELGGSCGAAPDRGRLRANSAIAAGRRYVFGVTGDGVEQVAATLEGHGAAPASRGGTKATGSAAAPRDRGAATEAGFPSGDRWFVLDLGPVSRLGGVAAPAVVTPLAGDGRQTGPAYVDCSLGVIGPACRRRIEAAATGH